MCMPKLVICQGVGQQGNRLFLNGYPKALNLASDVGSTGFKLFGICLLLITLSIYVAESFQDSKV